MIEYTWNSWKETEGSFSSSSQWGFLFHIPFLFSSIYTSENKFSIKLCRVLLCSFVYNSYTIRTRFVPATRVPSESISISWRFNREEELIGRRTIQKEKVVLLLPPSNTESRYTVKYIRKGSCHSVNIRINWAWIYKDTSWKERKSGKCECVPCRDMWRGRIM